MDINKSLEIIKSGTVTMVPEKELIEKLESGKKLKIKLGMDPTAPDLHLGHAVVLQKLKQFQDLGHEVIFLIGDYTASIGDPSGKSKTRPALTSEQIEKNSNTYFKQVGRILDLDKLRIVYNSEWLKKLNFADLIKLCSKITVARLIEREDFSNRLEKKLPIALHELLYPVIQGYDSVELQADVELGGTDQTFNLGCGRFLQEQHDQKPQVVITMPLLEGLDGVEKMSKSLGNVVGLTDNPVDAYGKLMSISDSLMWRYMKLLLGKTDHELSQLQDEIDNEKTHPMDMKKKMAFEIIELFWSMTDAENGAASFIARFEKKDYSDAKEVELLVNGAPENIWIVKILRDLGVVNSSSDAKRLILSGSVTIDEVVIKDFKAEVDIASGVIVKVGKHRFYKIV